MRECVDLRRRAGSAKSGRPHGKRCKHPTSLLTIQAGASRNAKARFKALRSQRISQRAAQIHGSMARMLPRLGVPQNGPRRDRPTHKPEARFKRTHTHTHKTDNRQKTTDHKQQTTDKCSHGVKAPRSTLGWLDNGKGRRKCPQHRHVRSWSSLSHLARRPSKHPAQACA